MIKLYNDDNRFLNGLSWLFCHKSEDCIKLLIDRQLNCRHGSIYNVYICANCFCMENFDILISYIKYCMKFYENVKCYNCKVIHGLKFDRESLRIYSIESKKQGKDYDLTLLHNSTDRYKNLYKKFIISPYPEYRFFIYKYLLDIIYGSYELCENKHMMRRIKKELKKYNDYNIESKIKKIIDDNRNNSVEDVDDRDDIDLINQQIILFNC